MKRIFLSAIIILGLQNLVFAIDEVPSWNDFAPSVIKPENQSYWDARYREFESDLNECKALPAVQRKTCFDELAINEREKNKQFYANPSTVTSNSTVNEVKSSTFALSIGYPIAYGYGYRYWDYPECAIFPSFSYVRYHRVPPPPIHRHPIHRPPMHRPPMHRPPVHTPPVHSSSHHPSPNHSSHHAPHNSPHHH